MFFFPPKEFRKLLGQKDFIFRRVIIFFSFLPGCKL